MQLTLEIPENIAALLDAQGKDPAQIALDAWRESAAKADVREAIRQGREDISAGRTIPLHEGFTQFRERHGLES